MRPFGYGWASPAVAFSKTSASPFSLAPSVAPVFLRTQELFLPEQLLAIGLWGVLPVRLILPNHSPCLIDVEIGGPELELKNVTWRNIFSFGSLDREENRFSLQSCYQM